MKNQTKHPQTFLPFQKDALKCLMCLWGGEFKTLLSGSSASCCLICVQQHSVVFVLFHRAPQNWEGSQSRRSISRGKWRSKTEYKVTPREKESRYPDRKPPERQKEQKPTAELKGLRRSVLGRLTVPQLHNSELSKVYSQKCTYSLPTPQGMWHQSSASTASFSSQPRKKQTMTLQLQIFGKDVCY